MRTFILALDGLDANLVQGWKLKNLLQMSCGTFSVAEFGQDRNLSTSVWASFITGRYHYFKSWWKRAKLYGVAKRFIHSEEWLWRVAKWLKPKLLGKENLKHKNIFELVPNAIAVNVPVYNEKTEYHLRKLDALHLKGVDAYADVVGQIHVDRIRDVAKAIDKHWQLFMCWFDIADLYGHLYIGRNDKLLEATYRVLDGLAEDYQKIVGNSIFLIISDHGMQPVVHKDIDDPFLFGEHTRTAFWSLNRKADWKPKTIVDFFPKILEWTKQ